MPKKNAVALLVGIVALVACGKGGDAVEPVPVPCSGSVTVSIRPGATPMFSWTPVCLIDHLIVEATTSGIGDRWAFSGSVAPPVTYGVLPSGATLIRAPEPLIQGTEYRLVVERTSPPTFLATQLFRP